MNCNCDFSKGQWSCRCGAAKREKQRNKAETKALFYGWYSSDQDELGGSSYYFDVDGNEVRITLVSKTDTPPQWKDAIYVGKLVRWSRSVRVCIKCGWDLTKPDDNICGKCGERLR